MQVLVFSGARALPSGHRRSQSPALAGSPECLSSPKATLPEAPVVLLQGLGKQGLGFTGAHSPVPLAQKNAPPCPGPGPF